MSEFSQTWRDLKVDLDHYVLSITLNRPEASNAFSIELIEDLVALLKKAEHDSSVRVIILTGNGKCFSAGGDIKAMEESTGMFAGDSNELRERYQRGIQQIPLTIESLSKPLIAAVNGPAIGAGCDLAAMCDLRIGTPKTKMGETFCKLGLVPGDGGTYFLPRVVGYAKAMEMFLTGRIYSSDQALEMGLLNKLVPLEDLLSEAKALAFEIANNAPIAVQMTKKAMKSHHLKGLENSLDLLASFQGITQRSEDHFEGIKAFKEKRAPNFQGT